MTVEESYSFLYSYSWHCCSHQRHCCTASSYCIAIFSSAVLSVYSWTWCSIYSCYSLPICFCLGGNWCCVCLFFSPFLLSSSPSWRFGGQERCWCWETRSRLLLGCYSGHNEKKSVLLPCRNKASWKTGLLLSGSDGLHLTWFMLM